MLYDFNSNDVSNGVSNNVIMERQKHYLWEVLKTCEVKGHFKDVASLADAVQRTVLLNRHMTFHSNRLLQRMRFILIKCLPNLPRSPITDNLRNFFFDISISPDLDLDNSSPSDDMIALKLPRSMLKIVIIGGGPTGLSAAINLAERVRCRELVQIHVYDKRWMKQNFGELHFTVYPEDERRRDQVVTLQDHVTELLSPETRHFLNCGLGKRGAERVWPESSNLQIRKVEDALLKRAQDSVFDGIIHLHGAEITDEATLIQEAGNDFHLLLGTDGANSWVRRRYFSEEEEPCGRSFALGLALDRGDKGLPHPQALNIFLTLCQTRFLLNASDRDGKGYLNILLSQQEYDQCVSVDRSPADFGSPAYVYKNNPRFRQDKVFAPLREVSDLWLTISDGLHLFGFSKRDVKSVVRIPINLMGVKTATKVVTFDSKRRRRPHCLVSLAGDSALTHHFWPGRGMNSGIKTAIAWSNQISDLILEHNEGLVGLQPLVLSPFLDFMKNLREREHTHRSFVIQENSGSPERMKEILTLAHELREQDREIVPILWERVLYFANRLESRGPRRWQHEKVQGLRGTVLKILALLLPKTKAEMYHSGPWPTEKMNYNAEVLPPKSRTPSQPRSRAEGENSTSQKIPTMLSKREDVTHTNLHWLNPTHLDRFKNWVYDKMIKFWHGTAAAIRALPTSGDLHTLHKDFVTMRWALLFILFWLLVSVLWGGICEVFFRPL